MKIEPEVKKQWTPVKVTFETEEEFVMLLGSLAVADAEDVERWIRGKKFKVDSHKASLNAKLFAPLSDYYEGVKS